MTALICGERASATPGAARVLVVASGEVDEVVLQDITQAVADEFSRKPGYEAIPPDDVRRAVVDQHTVSYDDCRLAPSCIRRIAKKLGAGHLLAATVKKDGGSYVLTLTRTSLADSKDVQSTSESMKRLKNMVHNVKLCLGRVFQPDGAASPTPAAAAAPLPHPPPKITVVPDAPAAKSQPASDEEQKPTASSAGNARPSPEEERSTPPGGKPAQETAPAPNAPKEEGGSGVQGAAPGTPEQTASPGPDARTPAGNPAPAAAPAKDVAEEEDVPEKPMPAIPDNPGAIMRGVRFNSIAVLDTVVQNVPASMGALTSQTLSSYAANTLGMEVVSKEDLRRLVSFQQLQQLVGCDGDACNEATALAQSIGVSRILTSTLGKIGDRFQLSVVAMDASTGKVIGRVTREIQSEEEILENARDLCHFALRHKLRESKGYVRVVVNTIAAQIAVDGLVVGISPLPIPLRLRGGNHAIHVEKKGFFPFDGSVGVEAGKEARVEVTLIAKSTLQLAGGVYLPWAGGTAGVALVLAAISVYGYETALARCRQYDLNSSFCSSPGQLRSSLDLFTLSSASSYVKFWDGVGIYGGLSSGIVGAASVALFAAWFITGLGAGGDQPPASTMQVDLTPTGPVLRF